MRVSLCELPEQKIALQECLAFNLLQYWSLGEWYIPLRKGKLLWVDYVLVSVNHLVAECAQDVLDVPIVYEQNQFVLVWIIVSCLDEQFILRVWSLVKYDSWNWLGLETNLLELLEQMLNPIVEHVYLRL